MVRRPVLDERGREEILDRTKELAPEYVESWDVDSEDAGTALLAVFAELGGGITERLNQTPVKHRTKFLDMLDFTPNPPQPATLPVTFQVRGGAPKNVVIPSGTMVEAVATDERPAQEFETVGDSEFEATPATLRDVYAVDPGVDRIVDHSEVADGTGSVELFTGENRQSHVFYMGHGEVLELGPGASFEVTVTTTAPEDALRDYLVWEYYGEDDEGEEGWHPLTVHDRDDRNAPSVSELAQVREVVEKLQLVLPHEGFAERTDAAADLTYKALADDVRKGRFASSAETRRGGEVIPSTLVDPDELGEGTRRTICRQLESLQQRLQREADGGSFATEPRPITLDMTVSGTVTERAIDGIDSRWIRARLPEAELSHAMFNTLVDTVTVRVESAREPEEEVEPEEVEPAEGEAGLFDELPGGAALEAEIRATLEELEETLPYETEMPSPEAMSPDIESPVGEEPETDVDEEVASDVGPSNVADARPPLEEEDEGGPIPPDMVIANNAQTDPRSGMDMLFFGEFPMTGMTSEFACETAFSVPGTEVAMQFEHVRDRTDPPLEEAPELVWEYPSESGWKPLDVTDRTDALQTSGTVSFEVPEDIGTEVIQGWEGHWIRVRLHAGDYGQPQIEGIQDGNWERVTDHIEFPRYSDVSITYDRPERPVEEPEEREPQPEPEPEPEPAVTEPVEEKPEEAEEKPEGPREFAHFVVENNMSRRLIDPEGGLFAPFVGPPGETQVLYLGFDRQLEGGPLHLYLPIEETTYPEGFAPLIDVEYCADPRRDEWQRTGIEDGTDDLTERGLLKVTMPEPTTEFELFGTSHHWLRIRITGDEFARTDRHLFVPESEVQQEVHVREVLSYQSLAAREEQSYTRQPPRIDGLYPNTAWAENVVTVEDAIVGSSEGTTEQTFELPDSPALDVEVWVDEYEALSERRAQEMIDDRSTTVEDVYDADGHLTELWVEWTEVSDFIGSDPDSRHYVLNETQGTITFGDGKEGAIPPEGENNVRADYKTGGGDEGDKQAGTVETLLDPLPNVEGVTNHEPGKAGEPAEQLAEFVKRAPKNLRDRGKPITRDGFVRIAKSTSPEIARVRCIAGEDETDTPGKVVLILVADVAGRKPRPSDELINRVETAMKERVPVAVVDEERSRLTIRGPNYVEISVTATVTTAGTRSATTVTDRAISALTAFAHPLTGGPEGDGWRIGTLPEPSLFAARLEKLDAVGYVKDLAVTYGDGDRQLTLALGESPPDVAPDVLVYSGRHDVTVDVGGEQ